ncbi:5'-nucleotidase C-terminal domain-containing protein [Methanoculleus sp.]|uniref:5'-nucleotidase C-terminal domain-containing protein n=1 Tax=Methanoculleus sp. TaxID=90427 RepID=UPI0025EDF0E1|nr:5'-nucleotidase C-terminal domain-containing protein [Methanoculleus sp.]
MAPVQDGDTLLLHLTSTGPDTEAFAYARSGKPGHYDPISGNYVSGSLVADGQRATVHAGIAFVTIASLRVEIAEESATWGDLYAVQPFSSTVLSMTIVGGQVRGVLEQE